MYMITGLENGSTATVTRDVVSYMTPVTSVIRARRVFIDGAGAEKMRRVPEYDIAATENTPRMIIQMHPGVKIGPHTTPRPVSYVRVVR